MSVSTKGFCENVLTLKAASGLKAGVPVVVSANDTVSAASADAKFCGVSVNVNGGYAGVQCHYALYGHGRPGGRLYGSRIGRRGWSQGEHKGQHISRAQRQHNRQNSELHALILKGE